MSMTMAQTITSPELQSRLVEQPGLTLIDVRTNTEFASRHIPGSINVPLAHVEDRVADLASVESPTVLVCQSGARSKNAFELMHRAGKTDLWSLEGGLIDWQNAGGDIAVGDDEKWAMDRQVRLAAGSLVLTGILGSLAVPRAKWLAGGIGGGLVFSAVSNTCTMGDMLSKLPYNQAADYDIDAVLTDLKARP